MTEPWGLSGLVFAWGYFGLAVLVTAGAATWSWFLGRGRRNGNLPSLAHVAMLSGGPGRVADTVVAGLLEREQARIDSSGKLYRTPSSPVDALGQEAVGYLGTGASVATICEGLVAGPAMRALTGDLIARRLLAPNRPRRLCWTLATGLLLALFALGVARWVNGVALGRPVGWLTAELVGVLVAGVSAAGLAWAARAPRVTKAGERARGTAWADRSLVTGIAGDVAVGGLLNHPDREIRKALRLGYGPTVGGAGAADGGGGGYLGSGGGCGSGGGGGRGCGG